MWWKQEKKPNTMDLVPDLLGEVFLGLPVESIQKFKIVSKEWRSILESKVFLERRMNLGKSRRKILAAHNCDCGRRPFLLPESRFEGDEEMVYLHCGSDSHIMTCDGLVCLYEPKWFNVLNPSTRQLRRFHFGLDKYKYISAIFPRMNINMRSWTMGFGRDRVTGSYKVVRVCLGNWHRMMQCALLDVETGGWRELSPPSHIVPTLGSESACVNGSIYWLQFHIIGAVRIVGGVLHRDKGEACHKLLALDLHKEEFHIVVSVPAAWITHETQLANLEDRLALAKTTQVGPELILEILSMDANEKRWTKTYSISLSPPSVVFTPVAQDMWFTPETQDMWFTPVAVSKQGNLVLYDNHKRLFKYYPRTDEIRCLSSDTCVVSLHLENLVPLPLNSSHDHDPNLNPDPPDPFQKKTYKCPLLLEPASWISKLWPPRASTVLCVLLFIYLVFGGVVGWLLILCFKYGDC